MAKHSRRYRSAWARIEHGQRYPLIAVIHGGPEAHVADGWISSYSRPAHALAAEGYVVALPNYRGSTGRGVEFSKLGQNDYADAEFNDIVDLKRHLVAEGLIDPDRVGISGGSYGGYATMWSASALTEEYAAAVAFVGISNQVSKFGTSDIPTEMYLVHSRVWPWEDWMWLLERSPVFHAGKTRTPLLIMHGDSDPRVHPEQSLEMYRNVKLRTDTPVRLVYYPGDDFDPNSTATVDVPFNPGVQTQFTTRWDGIPAGNYIAGTTTVTFGGLGASNVVIVDATTITCDTPAHSAGPVDVTVTNSNGSATLPGGFTYHGLPTISSVSPTYFASGGTG